MKMLGYCAIVSPRRMDSFAFAQSLERPAGPELNQLFTAEGQLNDVNERQSNTP
jgi:hypothetical protein